MPIPDPESGEVQHFSQWLATHARGMVDDQLTDEFTRLIQSALTLEKVAVLSIKVKIKPEGEGVVLSVSSTLTEPSPDPAASFYFADADTGMPSKRHPNQPSLPGVEVDP